MPPDERTRPYQPVRMLVADGHPVARAGVRALVEAHPDLRVVAEAADGPSALALAAELGPDVVVLGCDLPGADGADGAEVTARLRESCPGVRVLALTAREGAARRLLDAGAAGCVLKRSPGSRLVEAVRAVAAGGTYLDPSASDDPAQPVRGLSAREEEVLRLIALGYANKEIAARLKVSIKTVETYKTRSMEKLGLQSRVDIVRYAVTRGWL